MFRMKYAYHFFFPNDEDGGWHDGSCRAESNGFTRNGAFAEEIPGAKNRDYGFFATLINDRELYAAFLDIDYGVCRIALREDGLLLAELSDFSRNSYRVQIDLWIERALTL